MKLTKSKMVSFSKIFYMIVLATVVTILLLNLYYKNCQYFEANQIVFNENTMVKINNEAEQNVNFENFTFDPLSKGDTLTIKKILPNVSMEDPVVSFLVYHAVIDCYLDGELIYSYGHDLYEQNKAVGSDYYRIPIPSDFQNKELTLKFTVTEKNAFSSIHNIKLESCTNSYKSFLNSKIFIILIAVPMLLLGLVAFIFSTNTLFIYNTKIKIVYISLFAISVSNWILSSNRIYNLISNNISLVSDIEFLSIYLAPISLLLFFYRIQRNILYKRILVILSHILLLFNIVVIILNHFNISHYCVFLSYFQIMASLCILFVIYTNFKGYKQKLQHEKVLTYGIIFFLAVCVIDVIRFNLEKFLQITNVQLQISLVPFGAFVLIITFLYSYGIEMLNMLYKNFERQTLLKLAYVDVLTNIPNRAKCEVVINDLEKKTDSEIAVISLDLNNLKYVNDTYGHQYGDEMISKFSSILNDIFSDIAFIARMGGDEFIAILTDVENEKVEKALYDLSEALSNFNKTTTANYSLSVAYGYAIRHKNDNISLWYIYEIADKEMYKNKKIQKQILQKKAGGNNENYKNKNIRNVKY